MKPLSDLNAILQDGYSLQYDLPNYGIQDVNISTHQIGKLVLTSGKLLAWDLLMVPDDRYFFKKNLKPGRYPVILSVADFHPVGDSRIACAMLRFSEERIVRWEVAAINNPDPEETEELISYGVDSGTGSFMDLDAAEILAPEETFDEDEFWKYCDKVLAEMEKHKLGKYGRAGWAIMRASDSTEANIVTFSSGWGDGAYASFWGYDMSGGLTSLVTDFALF